MSSTSDYSINEQITIPRNPSDDPKNNYIGLHLGSRVAGASRSANQRHLTAVATTIGGGGGVVAGVSLQYSDRSICPDHPDATKIAWNSFHAHIPMPIPQLTCSQWAAECLPVALPATDSGDRGGGSVSLQRPVDLTLGFYEEQDHSHSPVKPDTRSRGSRVRVAWLWAVADEGHEDLVHDTTAGCFLPPGVDAGGTARERPNGTASAGVRIEKAYENTLRNHQTLTFTSLALPSYTLHPPGPSTCHRIHSSKSKQAEERLTAHHRHLTFPSFPTSPSAAPATTGNAASQPATPTHEDPSPTCKRWPQPAQGHPSGDDLQAVAEAIAATIGTRSTSERNRELCARLERCLNDQLAQRLHADDDDDDDGDDDADEHGNDDGNGNGNDDGNDNGNDDGNDNHPVGSATAEQECGLGPHLLALIKYIRDPHAADGGSAAAAAEDYRQLGFVGGKRPAMKALTSTALCAALGGVGTGAGAWKGEWTAVRAAAQFRVQRRAAHGGKDGARRRPANTKREIEARVCKLLGELGKRALAGGLAEDAFLRRLLWTRGGRRLALVVSARLARAVTVAAEETVARQIKRVAQRGSRLDDVEAEEEEAEEEEDDAEDD
ncbi:hypothetical protein DFH27DRAFT_617037 [Peziza echinospora]|nr:hypothetical protein DFH27DRAFT_617037 [Peziza echinospora]